MKWVTTNYYKTACGFTARIYETKATCQGFIHGAVMVPLGPGGDGWNLVQWDENGNCAGGPTGWDLTGQIVSRHRKAMFSVDMPHYRQE